MKVFSAKVVDSHGKSTTITEEAISEALFEESLTKKGYFIVKIKESESKKSFFLTSSVKKSFLLDFTYNVFTLLDFGVDINEVFRILAEIYSKGQEHEFISDVISHLKKGEKLTQAIINAKNGHIFDDFYIAMLSSGEQSGNLKDAFKLLYDYIKNNQKMRDKIIVSAMYPGILLCMFVFLIHFFFMFMIPNTKRIYDNLDIDPGFFVNTIFNISDFLRNNFLIYIIIIAAVIFGLVLFFRTKMSRKFVYAFFKRMPVISKVFNLYKKIRISYSLEILLNGGLSLEESLLKLTNFEKDEKMREEYFKSLNSLKEGNSVKNSFNNLNVFSNKDLNIIEIADSISKTPEGFARIYNDTINYLENYLEIIVKLIEPVIIVLLGFVVFILMYIMIIPTVKMMENIGNY